MRALSKLLTWMIVPLALIGCEVAPPESTFLPEDRVGIETLVAEFGEAVLVEDWDLAAAMFREDAILMPPGESPVMGRAAILDALAVDPEVDYTAVSIDAEEVDGGAFIAYARGSYHQQYTTPTPEGEVMWTEEGSWLAVLRRDDIEPETPWAIHSYIWNSDVPDVTGEGS